MARPNPGNATTPPPQTNPEAPVNPEGQKSLQEGMSGNNPPPLENTQFMPVPLGLKHGKCLGTFLSSEKIGQFPLPTIPLMPQILNPI